MARRLALLILIYSSYALTMRDLKRHPTNPRVVDGVALVTLIVLFGPVLDWPIYVELPLLISAAMAYTRVRRWVSKRL